MTDAPSHRGEASLRFIVACGVAHAILMTLVFPPIDAWWLVFIAGSPVAAATVAARRFRVVLPCLLVPMIGTWLWHQWWVTEVSAAGIVPMAIYLALWTPLIAWVIRRLARSRTFGGWPLALLVPLAWTGVEFLRSVLVFDGYPWYLLGQPLIGWLPLAQPADIAGINGLAILPAATGGLLADFFLGRGSRSTRRIASIATASLVVIWTGYGLLRVQPPGTGRLGPAILAIQTVLPQSNKVGWSPRDQWDDTVGFARQTIEAAEAVRANGGRIDLIAWPETMLPGIGIEPASTAVMEEAGWWPGNRFAELAMELQSETGVPLLLGSASFEGLRRETTEDGPTLAWDRRFNSVYLLDERGPEAATRYDKVFLTPFGERMPYISSWPWLEQRMLDIGARGMQFDLDAASDPVRLILEWRRPTEDVLGSTGIGTPICFEDTVPSVCRDLVWENGRKLAPLLLNASNDGWFGPYPGPRSTHLQLARFRSIENRVPMVRAVNTGRSAWIDSSGRLRAAAPALVADAILAETELDDRRPPFATLGERPIWSLTLICILMLIWSGLDSRRTNPRNS
ncbi:MAG: apolipoprotein N-acyltransferase [Planctomycetaceae bacterium]|nr:apolipoprotein N-acyltransferase [Planctomycetaceae bacterium]